MKIKPEINKYWTKIKILKIIKTERDFYKRHAKSEDSAKSYAEAYTVLLENLTQISCEEVFEVVKFDDFPPPKPKEKPVKPLTEGPPRRRPKSAAR